MPEVSVIVPVYNVENYMRRCMDSLLAQTFTDIEILLIDDGSKDSSGAICDEYALKDDRIKVIHKANGGVSSARNAGLDVASGRYIMFCDPDDYVDATWCQKLFEAIERRGAFFACCGYNCMKLSGKIQRTACIKEEGLRSAEALEKLYITELISSVCCKIFNTAIINENSIKFDEKISKAEDLLFVLSYLRTKVGNVEIVPEPLYKYVTDRPHSLVKQIVPEHWKLVCRVYDEVRRTMQAYDVGFSEYKDEYYFRLVTEITRSINMIFGGSCPPPRKYLPG